MPSMAIRHLIHLLNAPSAVAAVHQLSAEETRIGRDLPLPGLTVSDARMSRTHARLRWNDRSIFVVVEDLGSKNGVFVNGQRTISRALADGDVIRLGDTVIAYEQAPATACAPAPEFASPGIFSGPSVAAARLRRDLEAVRESTAPLLFYGESGSGRESAARLLHARRSSTGAFTLVRSSPAAPLDVKALDATLSLSGAHSADTLYVDGLADVEPDAQLALVRLLAEASERRPHVVVASTFDLRVGTLASRVLPDLASRLLPHMISVPSLRRRRPDIVAVLRHLTGDVRLTGDACEGLAIAGWPGNLRELVSVIRRASTAPSIDGRLDLDALPEVFSRPIRRRLTAPQTTTVAFSRPSAADLAAALDRFEGRVADVAIHYQKSRLQIMRWMERYGIPVPGGVTGVADVTETASSELFELD